MIIDKIAYDFLTDFNGPSRLYPNKSYETGIYEDENPKYNFGPESTRNPILTMPYTIYDGLGNEIPDGFYMVTLSRDKEYMLLWQSNQLKAKIKVIKLIEKQLTKDEIEEEEKLNADLRYAQYKGKLKKIKLAEEAIKTYKTRQLAIGKAVIKDTGNGYYTINYEDKFRSAVAIIKK